MEWVLLTEPRERWQGEAMRRIPVTRWPTVNRSLAAWFELAEGWKGRLRSVSSGASPTPICKTGWWKSFARTPHKKDSFVFLRRCDSWAQRAQRRGAGAVLEILEKVAPDAWP